ncbi:MAG: hypothetical protein Kow00117_11400 [Phototrophicales bacterium]
MRIVTNEALVKRNRKIATRLFFFSLGVLILGFFLANGNLLGLIPEDAIDPQVYMLFMPVVLLVGLVTTLISVRMTNLWIRVPRPEDAIAEGLKGVSSKNVLYNYFHFPARHVLITQQAIFPIVTRFQDGKFTVKGKKWRAHKGPIVTIFTLFRLDGIGNPFLEAEQAKKYLEYIIEDYDKTIPVQPLVVFVDSRAQLEIEDPIYPVLYADSKKTPSLKNYLKEFGENIEQLSGKNREEFLEEFEAATL